MLTKYNSLDKRAYWGDWTALRGDVGAEMKHKIYVGTSKGCKHFIMPVFYLIFLRVDFMGAKMQEGQPSYWFYFY